MADQEVLEKTTTLASRVTWAVVPDVDSDVYIDGYTETY